MAATLNRAAYIAIAALLCGCAEDIPPVRKFKQGDIVEFIVSGQRAQIIYENYCEGWKQRKHGMPCTYDVRVFSPQTFTNTHLIGSDGPITTVHIARLDYVKEYELRKAQ